MSIPGPARFLGALKRFEGGISSKCRVRERLEVHGAGSVREPRCSTSKLFLAADDPQRVRSYATRTGLAGHTRNSITQLPALERELSKARQYGIARDNEELELGVRCMAAGIYHGVRREPQEHRALAVRAGRARRFEAPQGALVGQERLLRRTTL
jgi:DNA-binding IclR family transcriptional regulator